LSPHIDHVVIAVKDLERAARQYEALGFTLTPRALHPWGTANQLIQLETRSFIELLEIDRPALISDHAPRATPPRYSFGAFNREFLEHREGMSMLVLESHDTRADVARFDRAGLQCYAPFDFERKATLPDGTKTTVAFSLAFATHPDAPGAGFFTCHNRFPDAFWRSQYQTHVNAVQRISEVVMTSGRPEHYAGFLATFTGCAAVAGPEGPCLSCGPQLLRVLEPDALSRRFPGESYPKDGGLHFVALVVAGRLVRPGSTPSGHAGGVSLEWRNDDIAAPE